MDRFNEEIDLMLFESLERDGILMGEQTSQVKMSDPNTALTTTTPPTPEQPSPADQAAQKDTLQKAAEILAIRVMDNGETVNKIQDASRILRKYFISKTVRAEQLTKESFLLEASDSAETPDEKTIRMVRNAGSSSDSSTKELFKALTKEIDIPLKDMKKNLSDLRTTITPQRQEEHDQRMKDSDYEDRFKGVVLFINRFAGKNLNEIKVDLNELKKHKLDESFLRMFGAWIKYILNSMFGGFDIPVSVTGNKREVEAFGRAVAGEKKYIDSAKRYGLNHATTYKNKAVLDTATKNFERETGLKWPFK
jgi:hypothetical protein